MLTCPRGRSVGDYSPGTIRYHKPSSSPTRRYSKFGAFWDPSAPQASDRVLPLPFPGSSAYRIAAFVKVDVIEHGHDRFPLEAALLDALRECR